MAVAVGFCGQIRWDSTKPDGTPKKQLNVSRLAQLGWQARIDFVDGLSTVVAEFREEIRKNKVRL